MFTANLPGRIQTVPNLPIAIIGKGNAAGLGKPFEARGNIDAVAQQVIPFRNHVAHMDTDAKLDLPRRRDAAIAFCHAALDGNGTTHVVNRAGKFQQITIARRIGDAAAVVGDQWINQLGTMHPKDAQGSLLVLTNQARIACDVSGNDRRQQTLCPFRHGPSVAARVPAIHVRSALSPALARARASKV